MPPAGLPRAAGAPPAGDRPAAGGADSGDTPARGGIRRQVQACAALAPAQAELKTLLLAMLDRLRRRPSAIGRWRPYLCHLAGEHHLAERVRKLACR